jgi:hypothetical protein
MGSRGLRAGSLSHACQVVMTDCMIFIARNASPVWGNDESFTIMLWRGTQLYLCSFLFTLRCLGEGIVRSARGTFCNADLTVWNSGKANRSRTTRTCYGFVSVLIQPSCPCSIGSSVVSHGAAVRVGEYSADA